MAVRFERIIAIVLDSVGIGELPDAARYGDEGSDTLGNVARAAGGLHLPVLESLGLGRCSPVRGLSADLPVRAAYGSAEPASAGKDSTTGHWELAGVVLEQPFPTYPNGFPAALLQEFSRRTGRGVLGGRPASGTAPVSSATWTAGIGGRSGGMMPLRTLSASIC